MNLSNVFYVCCFNIHTCVFVNVMYECFFRKGEKKRWERICERQMSRAWEKKEQSEWERNSSLFASSLWVELFYTDYKWLYNCWRILFLLNSELHGRLLFSSLQHCNVCSCTTNSGSINTIVLLHLECYPWLHYYTQNAILGTIVVCTGAFFGIVFALVELGQWINHFKPHMARSYDSWSKNTHQIIYRLYMYRPQIIYGCKLSNVYVAL